MALPKSNVSTEPVELSGGVVEIRGLSWEEVKSLKGPGTNAMTIAWATGNELADAEAWLSDPATIAGDVTKLIEAIMAASGLDEGAQFQKRPSDVPVDARGDE